ncbi:MAG: hypothetical protein RL497_2144 [Pseudomonadota bacterium]|jgi:predicted Zn finger-like uncharacterized protein
MADMITRCPQCATAFRITAAHLKLAQGSVRCGACFTIFNALENLSERATGNAPVSNLADDFLISDHMGFEDDNAETPPESVAKSSLFERVEQAKALPEKTEDADESWALALLSEEDLHNAELELPSSDEAFFEEEPNFRPFQASGQPIELSDAFLKATRGADDENSFENSALKPDVLEVSGLESNGLERSELESNELKVDAEKPAAEDDHSDLSLEKENSLEIAQPVDETAPADELQTPQTADDWVTALAQEHPELNADDLKDLQDALLQGRNEPAVVATADSTSNNSTTSNNSNNAHLIERIELDALEVTIRQRKGLSPQFWWGAGGLVALLLLLVQVAIIKMPQWRYDTPLSGAYALACQHLKCPQENRVDASKIHTKSLLVHEHPSHPGAFAVDAVIVNKATFVQPFPRLILSFRNLQNQLINERIFLPAEYLGGEMAGERNMPIKQEIRIGLEILDPGKEAVSYNLSVD